MDASRMPAVEPARIEKPSFREALRFWVRLGFISFGGPAGQIAILHREVVERRRWIDERRFASGLAFCTFLPGPEAQQLATYIGWSLHGTRGGLAAGILFFLPATLLLLLLSFLRAEYAALAGVSGVLYGLRPVVVGIIVDAALWMARRRLATWGHAALAAAAFVAAFSLRVPFPWIIAAAALAGLAFAGPPGARPVSAPPFARDSETRRIASVLGVGLGLWLLPYAALRAWGDAARLFETQYLFFTQAALVTFGGAYAVLGYVSHAAVVQFGWLSRAEVVDGLALAETTPGPLIIVLQYVGFLAAWNHPGGLSPGLSGTIGALVTSYATFLPSLVLVFLGAPHVERIAAVPRLTGGLGAMLAAVTGVVISLGLDYGIAVVLPDDTARLDLFALVLLIASAFALRARIGLGWVLLTGAAAGLAHGFVR